MDTKPRLLIATDNFLPRWDGIARFLSEIVPKIKNDFDVTIVAPDFKGSAPDLGVRVVRIPLSRLKIGDFNVAKFRSEEIKKLV